MPLMKSLAPVRLASRAGHTVVVTPEGAFVPPVLVPEALSRGCVPVEESKDSSATVAANPVVESVQAELPLAEGDPRESRLKQVRGAVTKLIENNDPADFTATGVPRVAAVRRVFDESVTSEEIAEAMLLVKGG